MLEKQEKRDLLPEERYEFLVKNIHDAIVELDLDRTITYINPIIYDIIGFRPEDIIGHSMYNLVHPEDKKRLEDAVNKGIKEKKEANLEFRLRHKKGHYVPVAMRGTMATTGKKIIPMAVLRDITERKEAERRLQEYADKYNNILNHTTDIIAEVDMKGAFTYISPQIYDITGIEPKYFIGKTWYSFAASDVEDVKRTLHPSQSVNDINFEFKTEKSLNSKELWLEVKGKRFQDKTGTKKDMIIVRDITAKKKTEASLRKSLEKENFYRNLFTHDINNILHIIQTSVSLFKLFQNDPSKVNELDNLVNLMKEQIVRGTLLVSNVRRLAELESLDYATQSMDICEVLRNAIKFIREGFHNTQIIIDVNFDGELFFVQANELLINVFENILINASKYTDNPIVEINIKISTERINQIDHIKIEFIDNGIGIPDDKKDLIFKEGHEKDKGGKGMGFGLSLVKKIVESYNGQVWVEDRVKGNHSKGSNFIIILPKHLYCKYK